MTALASEGKKNRIPSLPPIVIASFLCVAALVIGGLVSPGFASSQQIINMLVLSSFLGLVAAGQTLIVIGGGGGIDLSVGKMTALGAILGGLFINQNDANIPWAFALTLAITFALGLFNGVAVSYLRIPPLVQTLAMSIILISVIRFVTQGVGVSGATETLRLLVVNRYMGIPSILFVWAGVIALMELVLRRTTFGLVLYAMGSNERVAYLSGVNVRRFRMLLFGLCGMICGFAGFVYLGWLKVVYNTTMGDRFVLPSIIGVVIGGVSMSGGRGSYAGVAVGCFMLTVLESLLVTINVDQSIRNILFGALLISIMALYGREAKAAS